jgi:hypothetical protein
MAGTVMTAGTAVTVMAADMETTSGMDTVAGTAAHGRCTVVAETAMAVGTPTTAADTAAE